MTKDKKAKVNKEIEGFDVKVNEFGELKSNMPIDEINKFLNKNVNDKKLRDRDDLEQLKSSEEA